MELPLWLRILESLAAIATPVLIAIGGVFAYYKFFRQGEHDPRLQPSVTSEVAMVKDGTAFIIATVSVQNTGRVDVTLKRDSCALLVLGREAGNGWRDPDLWYEVFLSQNVVQANAALEERIWIEHSLTDEVALCLELAISAEEGPDWRTSEIISLLGGLDGGQTSTVG